MIKDNIITIDGPSGAGKGTIAMEVARTLGFSYLDSGAIYRAVAIFCLENHIEEITQSVLDSIPKITQKFYSNMIRVYLGEREITDKIRTEECAKVAGKIASLDSVRAFLLDKQRDSYDKSTGLVCDGRDMGSVVFPNAILKIFLIATPEVRAKRRLHQLEQMDIKGNIEKAQNYENVLAKIKERDYNDEHRAHSPLVCPVDAVVVDTSQQSIEETRDFVIKLFGKAKF